MRKQNELLKYVYLMKKDELQTGKITENVDKFETKIYSNQAVTLFQ